MSEIHHKEAKEKKTKKLLIRALEMLIKSKSNITLSKKKYNKINFSYGQIIDAMKQIATSNEILDDIVIKSTSTISKNKTYRELIEKAKEKRLEIVADIKTNGKTGNLELDIMLVEQENASLRYELTKLENQLKTTAVAFELLKDDSSFDLKDQASLSKQTNENRYKKILKNLLIALNNDYGFIMDSASNGKASKYYYINQNTDEQHFICYEDEIQNLLTQDIEDDMDLLE